LVLSFIELPNEIKINIHVYTHTHTHTHARARARAHTHIHTIPHLEKNILKIIFKLKNNI